MKDKPCDNHCSLRYLRVLIKKAECKEDIRMIEEYIRSLRYLGEFVDVQMILMYVAQYSYFTEALKDIILLLIYYGADINYRYNAKNIPNPVPFRSCSEAEYDSWYDNDKTIKEIIDRTPVYSRLEHKKKEIFEEILAANIGEPQTEFPVEKYYPDKKYYPKKYYSKLYNAYFYK